MATIAGFKIFPVSFDHTVKSPHYFYIKKHAHQKNSINTPADRTLFIVNIPPYCGEIGLQNMLGRFGPIETISLQTSPGKIGEKKEKTLVMNDDSDKMSFQVAYIVFKSHTSVTKLLSCEDLEENYISTEEKQVKTGMEKWCAEYKRQIPNPQKLQKEIDKFMLDFDIRKEREKELELQQAEPDDEGWTLVTHGSKKGAAPPERVTKKDKKKKQEKELINFYSFQQRESRREHIASLRKKFEDDKKRIETMRTLRKFKPF